MLEHTIITASAGSGKTWSLTVRYLRLLAMGVAPESVVALSFTRKSAGEFFGAIVRRLAAAAESEDAARALAADIELPALGRAEFRDLLVTVIRGMHRLALGTMDSFFVRIARSFPFELGLDGGFNLLDEHSLTVERERVYRRVFSPEEGSADARRAFLHAFQEATWGREEVRLRANLDRFVGDWHALLAEAPHRRQWGNPDAIWPGGRPHALDNPDPAAWCAAIRDCLAAADLRDSQRETWDGFLTVAEEYVPGASTDKSFAAFLDKLLDALPALRQGDAEITVARVKQPIAPPLADCLAGLCDAIVSAEIAAALRRTRGVHDVLASYERNYAQLVRRQGKLTFGDVQWILGGSRDEDPGCLHADNRALVDYRLDAKYHHWLLDEFQDTSRVQWNALANLCDEAIQDGAGEKSFFAVGDAKQSIYRWRGAEPALFAEILHHYNRNAPLIRERPLSVSFRSGPAVIDMVNDLFGDAALLRELLPAETVGRWRWDPHQSVHTEYAGCAVVEEVDAPEKNSTAPEPALERAADILSELDPLRRGLTCAVLCHTNDRAQRIADHLRDRTRMEVVCDSEAPIANDNPATSALLALVKSAAHPGDEWSWRHVAMSPLHRVVKAEFPTDAPERSDRDRHRRSAVALRVLSELAESGFEQTLRRWSAALVRALPEIDSFSRMRLDELCRCAREFDRTGTGDPDDFAVFAGTWRLREAATPEAIQVMTVHKSKGLTFDVVILPDLASATTAPRKAEIATRRGDAGAIDWLTMMPRNAIASADPVFDSVLASAAAGRWLDRLSHLYVAVTRARFANYLLIPPPPKKPAGVTNLAALVRAALCRDNPPDGAPDRTLALYGDRDWIAAHPRQSDRAPVPGGPAAQQLDFFGDTLTSPPAEPAPPPPAASPRPVRPSRSTDRRASRLFAAGSEIAREHGILVHNLLSAARWNDDDGRAALEAAARPDNSAMRRALAEARRCLADPALACLFAPRPDADVWRERAFDAAIDGVWYSGVFDRVVVSRSPDGSPVSAVVADFKTTGRPPAAGTVPDRYRQQLVQYRNALARLASLPPAAIRCLVVFTATPVALEID